MSGMVSVLNVHLWELRYLLDLERSWGSWMALIHLKVNCCRKLNWSSLFKCLMAKKRSTSEKYLPSNFSTTLNMQLKIKVERAMKNWVTKIFWRKHCWFRGGDVEKPFCVRQPLKRRLEKVTFLLMLPTFFSRFYVLLFLNR